MAQVQKKNDYITNSGSRFKQDILYKWDEKENCMVPYLGEKYDIFEQIQLSKNSVDLNMIIKRAKAGDMSVLNVRQANYADVSDLPDNLNDLNALHLSIEDNFDKLDPNLRNLFGNDVSVFTSAVADGSYYDKIKSYCESFKTKEDPKKGEGDK